MNLCHSCLATYTNKIPIRYPITPLEKSYCPPSESPKRFHTAADSQLQHGTGLCVLPESHSTTYGEKNDDDHVQVIGKVIGTVSADEIPDEEDSAILKDLKSEELYEFEREDGIPL